MIHDIKRIETGISTYELIKSKRFPVLKIGKDYLIPMEGFDRWLREGNMGEVAELVQM